MQHQASFKDGSSPNRGCCEQGAAGQDEELQDVSQMCRRLSVRCGLVRKKACGTLNASLSFLNVLLVCTDQIKGLGELADHSQKEEAAVFKLFP